MIYIQFGFPMIAIGWSAESKIILFISTKEIARPIPSTTSNIVPQNSIKIHLTLAESVLSIWSVAENAPITLSV